MGGPGPEQAHQQQGAAQQQPQQADQDSVDAFVHPIVMQLNAMAVNSPNPPMAQILELVRHHPADYDAMMRAIHRLWGNQVALQVSIAVPHVTLGAGGSPALTTAPAAAGAGEHTDAPEVETDPITGERDGSRDVGPATVHATAQGNHLTGGSVEVAGDVGANTHAGASVGVGTDGTVSAEGDVTHRVSQHVAVGANASVEGDHGEVRAQGGASIRLHLNDITTLRVAGAVDSHGTLNQEVALEILTDPTPRVPISDDGHKRLRIFLRASEPTTVGQDPAASAPNVGIGIGGSF